MIWNNVYKGNMGSMGEGELHVLFGRGRRGLGGVKHTIGGNVLWN
jgi:hypothetical protein